MAGRDSADFDTFYTATVRRVVLYLYAACGDRSDAQDIAQEAFARAWQHWPKVADYDDPEAWVRSVAWRLMINRWRGLRRRLAAWTRMGPPNEVTGGPSPDRVAVIDALQRLPAPQRQVIARHYLLDMPVQEIAATTGVPRQCGSECSTVARPPAWPPRRSLNCGPATSPWWTGRRAAAPRRVPPP